MASDVFCVRAARPVEEREAGQENEATFCDPLPSALTISGPPLLPAKPLPYLFPSDPRTKEILLVGTVRGAVTSVSVTMFGQTTAADVHPLPATGDRRVGAYAVWLPRSGQERAGMNLADITAVVGYDASGSVVTRLA